MEISWWQDFLSNQSDHISSGGHASGIKEQHHKLTNHYVIGLQTWTVNRGSCANFELQTSQVTPMTGI